MTLAVAVILLQGLSSEVLSFEAVPLKPGLAPVDNPLKGLVPYEGAGVADGKVLFPHSMEFQYIALSSVVRGPNDFDWSPVERLLEGCRSRGNQTVIRFFAEYPGQKEGIPKYLLDAGLRTWKWTADGGVSKDQTITPDYRDERLVSLFERFIVALGSKFDGDPRLGYMTAGLLGLWGEWHNYPRDDLFAPPAVQARILSAFQKSFKQTPILLRYPTRGDARHTNTMGLGFGFHDDSFAYATLPSQDKDRSWFFMNLLREAGGLDVWKSRPIGGEIRPEVWGKIFDTDGAAKMRASGTEDAQDFDECVRQTHATWLMDSGMFRGLQSSERIRNASESVRKMGYDLRLKSVRVREGQLELAIENDGVAPLYAKWPISVGLLNSEGKIVKQKHLSTNAAMILPQSLSSRVAPLRLEGVEPGRYGLLLRIENPMPGGKALGFANVGLRSDRWLPVGSVKIR